MPDYYKVGEAYDLGLCGQLKLTEREPCRSQGVQLEGVDSCPSCEGYIVFHLQHAGRYAQCGFNDDGTPNILQIHE